MVYQTSDICSSSSREPLLNLSALLFLMLHLSAAVDIGSLQQLEQQILHKTTQQMLLLAHPVCKRFVFFVMFFFI